MGNSIKNCCNPDIKTDKLTERVQVKMDNPIKVRPRRQNNEPEQFYFKPIKNNLAFEKQILEYKANERRIKKTLKVDLTAIEGNQIDEVFYIESQKAFYIGEWAYDRTFQSDVPCGIGRLYQADFISEGEFGLQPIEFSSLNEQQKNELTSEMKEQLKSVLQVVLQGKGRKFNQLEYLEGDFVNGKLEGTGTYQNRQKNKQYTYQGSWAKGRRKGRGIETTKQYIYNGEFENDKREGKGIFTYMLAPKLKHDLELNDKRVQERLKNIEMREQSEKNRKDKLKQQQKNLYDKVNLVLSNYPWQNPFKGDSLMENPDFYRERLIRTIYQETYNGDFKDDRFDGYGMYVWHCGKVYRGHWRQGQLHGVGEFIWANNIVYRGEYFYDQRHGKGEMVWSNCLRWRGSWAYGHRHGYGESIQVDVEKKRVKITGGKWDKDRQIRVFFKQVRSLETGDVLADVWESQSSDADNASGLNGLEQLQADILLQTIHKLRADDESIEQQTNSKIKKQMEPELVPNIFDLRAPKLNDLEMMKSTAEKSQFSKMKGSYFNTDKTWMRVGFFDS